MNPIFKTLAFFWMLACIVGCLHEKATDPTPISSTTTSTATLTTTTSATSSTTTSTSATTTTTLSLPCGGTATTTNTQNQVCFDTAILPLITSNCAKSGCHDAITRADGYDLSSYSKIISKGIVAGNYQSSKIYTEIANGSMPPKPNAALSATNRQLIADWIQQGAKQVTCAGSSSSTTPTTTTISYVQHIAPLMQLYCTGCHSTTSPSGGVDLSTYTAIKTYATNGKLYGSVAQLSGYKAMPQGSSKLSDCQLSVIKSWIDAGAINN